MKIIDNGHFITKCKLFSLLRNIWHRAVENDLNLIKWKLVRWIRRQKSICRPTSMTLALNFKISNTSVSLPCKKIIVRGSPCKLCALCYRLLNPGQELFSSLEIWQLNVYQLNGIVERKIHENELKLWTKEGPGSSNESECVKKMQQMRSNFSARQPSECVCVFSSRHAPDNPWLERKQRWGGGGYI